MEAVTEYLGAETKASGESGQERCRAALAAEVSGVRRHLAQATPS